MDAYLKNQGNIVNKHARRISTFQEEINLKEEMRKLKCRSPLESFGIWMLGNTNIVAVRVVALLS